MFYKLKELMSLLGVSRWMIDEMIDRGEFPQPLKLGKRSRRWLVSDVESWLRQRQERGTME